MNPAASAAGVASKSSACLALLFVLLAVPASAADPRFDRMTGSPAGEAPHLSVVWLGLSPSKEGLDDVPKALGFPSLSSSVFNLSGLGAGFSSGKLRVDLQAMSGGLSGASGGRYTDFSARVAALILEERYGGDSVLITGGFSLLYGELDVELRDEQRNITGYSGKAYGGGVLAGARWPARTRMGVMLRSGYHWLPFNGSWRGAQSPGIARTYFDLGGVFAQTALEIGF